MCARDLLFSLAFSSELSSSSDTHSTVKHENKEFDQGDVDVQCLPRISQHY